jgi:hypothetical protein
MPQHDLNPIHEYKMTPLSHYRVIQVNEKDKLQWP